MYIFIYVNHVFILGPNEDEWINNVNTNVN